jgi:DNA repair protein RecO (recombination protein O)
VNPDPCATPAILLRRRGYGDADLILTLLTRDKGKINAIAKAAKKSRHRFAGVLEPFSVVEAVLRAGHGMPLLQEAALIQPFDGLRTQIVKTAYAGYWIEIIDGWMEEGVADPPLYHLLAHALGRLDREGQAISEVSIFFQMQFLASAGIKPPLDHCCGCRQTLDRLPGYRLLFHPPLAGLLCQRCAPDQAGLLLSKGTIKQLRWMLNTDMDCCRRMRFNPQGLQEGERFLEFFVATQLGRKPRSLDVLKQLQGYRSQRMGPWPPKH